MMRIGLVRGLLALLLLPGISHALGLGDVHLNSPLNAPLDAEIELVNATPEDLATLDAKLASKDTFARYGLDWPPFMASITVTRDRSANGSQVLRVKSTDTVTEPFLTLLIEASWARGRLVRVIEEWGGIERDVVAIYQHRRHLSAKVKLFVDFLEKRFRQRRPW